MPRSRVRCAFLARERSSGTLAGVSVPHRVRWRNVIRASALALWLAAGLAVPASAARAATPPADDPDVSAWAGRYCTPLGCRGPTDSALGNALGFGVAATSVAFLARRRRA